MNVLRCIIMQDIHPQTTVPFHCVNPCGWSSVNRRGQCYCKSSCTASVHLAPSVKWRMQSKYNIMNHDSYLDTVSGVKYKLGIGLIFVCIKGLNAQIRLGFGSWCVGYVCVLISRVKLWSCVCIVSFIQFCADLMQSSPSFWKTLRWFFASS